MNVEIEADIPPVMIPADRARRPEITGTPVVLGGTEWLLADFIPVLEPVWDRIYDGNVLIQEYEPADLCLAAYRLLMANYLLTTDEAVALLVSAHPQTLVPVVETALFGPQKPYRGYLEWVRSSLLANGLDPKMISAVDRAIVLDQLVATGRAVPQSAFCSAAVAATKRRKLLGKLRG